MNPVRLVGGIALAVGGGLLLSNLFPGQAVLTELMGAQWATLQLLCGILVGVGLVALTMSVWETKIGNQGYRAASFMEEEIRMTTRLAKLYVATAISVLALYVFWIGIEEWVGILSPQSQILGAGEAIVLSLFGLGLGGRLGWKTVLEEFAIRCD